MMKTGLIVGRNRRFYGRVAAISFVETLFKKRVTKKIIQY